MEFTELEKQIISNTQFLKAKISVIKKIEKQFENVRLQIRRTIDKSNFEVPDKLDILQGKIFRGENYLSLPYVNLDFPKLFSGKDVFTFRTFFWWGNFFSATLHLEGKSLDYYRDIIIKNSSLLINHQVYVCINNNPWQYHYGEDNFVLLNEKNKGIIKDITFLKLSNKYSLDDFDNLPKLVAEHFSLLLKVLT